MPVSLRPRCFFFGLFVSVLTAAWVRGLTLTLGADSTGADLAIAAILLSVSLGSGLGSLWVQTQWNRWWPSFAIFGFLGALMILVLPNFGAQFQSLYHQYSGPWKSGMVQFLSAVTVSLVPFFFAGVAFSRMTVGADGEIITPLCFGAAAGIFLLDFLLGPFTGGLFVLLICAVGMLPTSLGLGQDMALIDKERHEAKRGLSFALLLGVKLGIAYKILDLYLLQFFPGTRADLSLILIFLLMTMALGAIGFGNPATVSKSPLLWAGFYASLAGSFLGISIWVTHYLASPERYLYYFEVFGVHEGSLLQSLLIVGAVAGLPALMVGACLRCLADPVSPSGRPSPAVLSSFLGVGISLGLLLTDFYLIPQFGLFRSLLIPVYGMMLIGVIAIFVFAQGTQGMKTAAASICTALALLSTANLPKNIETIENPYAVKPILTQSEVQGVDGIAKAVLEPGQQYNLHFNHNALTKGEDDLERLEIVLSLLFAGVPDEILLLNPITPLRHHFFHEAGVRRLDLSPFSAALEALSLKIVPKTAEPQLTVFRAPAGVYRKYPLILALNEPLWPASVSSRWTEETLEGIRNRLGTSGCFVLWVRGDENPAEALQIISQTFANVFTDTSAIMAFDGLEGPTFALIGRNQPWPIEKDAPEFHRGLLRVKANESFAFVPIDDLNDLLGLQIAHRKQVLLASAGAPKNRGPLPSLAWALQPKFDPKEQIYGIKFFQALSTSFTAKADSDSDETGTAIQSLLHGFIERKKNQRMSPQSVLILQDTDISSEELNHFFIALKLRPEFMPTIRLWEDLGRTLVHRRQFHLAADYLSKVAEIAPQRAYFQTLLGRAWENLSRPEDAAKAFRNAASLNPENGENWYFLGQVQAKLGDHRRAVRSFEEADRLDPRNVEVLVGLAQSFHALEDHERARLILEDAATIDPGHPKLKEAQLLYQQK